MGYRTPDWLPPDPAAADLRRHGRLRCEYIRCQASGRRLGDVVDLSGSGMRVAVKGRVEHSPEDRLYVTLRYDRQELVLGARLAWVRKVGFRRWLLGFEFIDIEEAQREALHRMTVAARDGLVLASAQHEQARTIWR